VRLADAVEKAVERAPTRGMTDKVRTTGELMLAFFGADPFLGIEISEDDRRGYPVIRRCTLDDNRAVNVAARLLDGRLSRVIVTDPSVGERPVIRLDLTDSEDQSVAVIRERTVRAARRLHGLLAGRRLRIVNEAERHRRPAAPPGGDELRRPRLGGAARRRG
jgi:hypothetical protein